MDTKFNLYDLFGVLIPGGVLCIIFHHFLIGMGWITPLQSGWIQTLILLPVAYIAGTFIHHGARRVFHVEHISLDLLTDDDPEFNREFTTLLLAKINEVFKVSIPENGINAKQFRQMAFKLCCDYVIQNGKGVYTENFNALYGMCRSMILVTAMGTFLAIVFASSHSDHPYALWPSILIAGIIVGTVFHQGMLLNARRFAISVYRSFYIATACPPPNSPPKG
jgi:hypothetical protein